MVDVKVHPEWKLLFEIFKDADYGTFISHEEIEKVIRCRRKDTHRKYYAFTNRWKREMLHQAGKQIDCLSGRGYQIAKPEGFRLSATRELKRGHRRIKQAGEIVVRTPIELLSDEEKKKVVDTSTIIAQVLHFQKITLKKVKQIDQKTDKLLLDVGKALDVAD